MNQKPIKRNRAILKLAEGIKLIAKVSLACLVLMLLFRIFTLSYTGSKDSLSINFFELLGIGWLNDFIFWLKLVCFLFIVFTPLYILAPKATSIILKLFIILFFIIDVSLSFYFTSALVPLGADLFGYSMKEIEQTVGASGGLNFALISTSLIIILVLIYVLFFLINKIKINRFLAASLPIFALLMISAGLNILKASVNLTSDYLNNLVANKSDFFYTDAANHFFPSQADAEFYALTNQKAAFKYINPEKYPFLHAENTPDVLSPFFKRENTNPPNIVFIIVEGLGRAFTNEGAYLGNFTPFIDSLSHQSLYWENFLSQGGRTFAVLPSLLGSLPFAKNGYLEMGNQMPPQLSVLNLLQGNGYQTSFYYGGDASFDYMSLYLKANHINQLNDEATFPSGYQKLPETNGFSWGYDDQSLFNYYLASQNATSQPKLSVILTVSTHNPFRVNQESRYLKAFENRMTALKFSDEQKQAYRNYKNQYASILSTDDALRNFFNDYQKKADYQNTIFLITGDHRMPEIPMSTKIDRYHVPLIIFSPMLKHSAQIASISTHFDVAPSLMAFLKNSYHIRVPKLSSWIGEGLDTTESFRNVHRLPFIQTKTAIIDFISGKYHLNGDNLYQLNPDLSEDLIEDAPKKRELEAEFYQFKQKNQQIIAGKKIVPDSLINNYTLKKP